MAVVVKSSTSTNFHMTTSEDLACGPMDARYAVPRRPLALNRGKTFVDLRFGFAAFSCQTRWFEPEGGLGFAEVWSASPYFRGICAKESVTRGPLVQL